MTDFDLKWWLDYIPRNRGNIQDYTAAMHDHTRNFIIALGQHYGIGPDTSNPLDDAVFMAWSDVVSDELDEGYECRYKIEQIHDRAVNLHRFLKLKSERDFQDNIKVLQLRQLHKQYNEAGDRRDWDTITELDEAIRRFEEGNP